jgi:hypothetical protein
VPAVRNPVPASNHRSGSSLCASRKWSAARPIQPLVSIAESASPVSKKTWPLSYVVVARARIAPGLPSMWKSGITARP